MLCKKLIILICTSFFSVANAQIERREIPAKLTTSLIIPCHLGHAKYLPNLVKEYVYNQTVLVDEIIISLSNIESVPSVHPTVLGELENTQWPIPVVVIKNEGAVSEGDNRNRACHRAKSDVFICQDADDIPHRQRIEVIKFLFEHYHVDHIVHGYYINGDSCYTNSTLIDFDIPDMKSIDWFCPHEYEINNGANGVASISRAVFDAIQWYPGFSHGIDVEFNRKAYELFKNRIAVKNKIYLYRQYYSGP
jgi:hypothetical protein